MSESPSMAVQIMQWVFGLLGIVCGLYFLVTGNFVYGKTKLSSTTARIIGVAMILFGAFQLLR